MVEKAFEKERLEKTLNKLRQLILQKILTGNMGKARRFNDCANRIIAKLN